MRDELIADETFEGVDYTTTPLPNAEYDNCSFIDCNFSGSSLAGSMFIDCELNNCDLSNASLKDTGLKGVRFSHCKLLGLHFMDCSPFLFSVSFSHCQLNYSSFYQMKMEQNIFDHCEMVEVDFTATILRSSVFSHCNLLGAKFDHSNLEKADFRTALNYTIDPEINRLKKAKFSLQGVVGLLQKYDITVD